MKTLAESSTKVLNDMRDTLTAHATNQSTPAPGLTSADGKMTTTAQAAAHRQAASTAGREVSLQGMTQLSLKDDPESKTRLNEALLMAFDALKTYGKEPEQLDSVKKLMHFALADYPWKKIQDALAFYFRYNTEFPAPADIVQIIERGNKPPFDRAVYTTLSKKHPADRTSDEWAYMREYESFMKG